MANKNNFNKKNSKRIRAKLEKKQNKKKLWLKDKIESKKNFNKRAKEKKLKF